MMTNGADTYSVTMANARTGKVRSATIFGGTA